MDAALQAATAGRLFFALLSLLVLQHTECFAGHPQDCQNHHHQAFDGSTLEAWSRTWHGPNAFLTPLTPYHIPRVAPCPEYGDYFSGPHGKCANCKGAVGEYYESEEFHAGRPVGGLPCEDYGGNCAESGFERLGRVPNDVAIAGQLPAGVLVEPGR